LFFANDDKAYVSSLRDREIVVLAIEPALAVSGRIKTKGQPGKVIVNRAGTLLFAAADNSDSVVIVDTKKDKVVAESRPPAPAGIFTNRGASKAAIRIALLWPPMRRRSM